MDIDIIAIFDDPTTNIISEVSRNTYRGIDFNQAKAFADETMAELGCQPDMPTEHGSNWVFNTSDYPSSVFTRGYYTEYHPSTGDMLATPSELWVYIGESPLKL